MAAHLKGIVEVRIIQQTANEASVQAEHTH